MTYGTRQHKNGSITGYLHFSTGKNVFLNKQENIDLIQKIHYWKDNNHIK